jgi:hypothetical protein
MLVTTGAPELAAELKRVEIGVEAELNIVEMAVDGWKPTTVDELPDDAVIDAPPDSILVGTLNTSVDEDLPTGGSFGLFVGAESMLMVVLDSVCGDCDC